MNIISTSFGNSNKFLRYYSSKVALREFHLFSEIQIICGLKRFLEIFSPYLEIFSPPAHYMEEISSMLVGSVITCSM